ncbi:MAG: Fic family protein, partial [Armatimonadetes bacterium]|nr:Fic family protein [Armatimonadota bacterium]
ETPGGFLHPIIRSILLHFWLAYDHPFVDGNGRTARTLFYWSARRHGYWLAEFLSISRILHRAPAQYGRAFLHVESDDNDLTYFLLHQVAVLRQAVQDLDDYVTRKVTDLRQAEERLRGMAALNHRQRALITHALRHPQQIYTIQGHRTSHGIVYQTARADLHDLAERGLLERKNRGRAFEYLAVRDLESRLRERLD